jgi:hypothetical protein
MTSIVSWFRHGFRESLFRNAGLPYRNSVGLLLGFVAAILLLSSGLLNELGAAWVFLACISLIVLALFGVRPYKEKELDRFAWGVFVIVVLGFGLGTLAYHYQGQIEWLWAQYRRIDEPHELILEALFLLGVILGFFLVRNWAKEQKDFVSSLSAIIGGAFVATVLGNIEKQVGTIPAFAYYSLGFTMSGVVNLIIAARLTANYTNKRTISSRAMLDFLYGSERATIIDGYFLKNFKEDPDYARRALGEALVEFRKLARRQFAERMHDRRKERPSLHYFQLIAIQFEGENRNDKKAGPEKDKDGEKTLEENRKYKVTYKEINGINEEMFRVGVAVRRQDMLEYIVAPGQYKAAFPLLRSVAGLALLVRQTIVMDRDRTKRFRSKDYPRGLCPADIEQARGLDEIDFLSYISIPVVSRLGSPSENALGVVNVDSKLFLAEELKGERVEGEEGICRVELTRRELTKYASSLYKQNDEHVEYLEQLAAVIVPILELYLKCLTAT